MTDEELAVIADRNDMFYRLWQGIKASESYLALNQGPLDLQLLTGHLDNMPFCRDVFDLLHEVRVLRNSNALSTNMIADWLDDQGENRVANMVRAAFPLIGDEGLIEDSDVPTIEEVFPVSGQPT